MTAKDLAAARRLFQAYAAWLQIDLCLQGFEAELAGLPGASVIIAVAVSTDGRREALGLALGPSEAEPFWAAFLRARMRRGLGGVKLRARGPA